MFGHVFALSRGVLVMLLFYFGKILKFLEEPVVTIASTVSNRFPSVN